MYNETLHPRRRPVKKSDVIKWIIFAIVALGAFIMMYPLLWMVLTSFKPNKEVYTPNLFPREWHFDAYLNIWGEAPLLRGTLNSIIVVVPTVTCSIFTASLAAYAFAKLKFWAKNTLFMILLGSTMIPGAVLLIPQYVLLKSFGLLTGPLGVIIPRLIGGAFTIFFLRQFLYGVPDSLIESAKIDGAGYLTIYVKIILPLISPALVAQVILGFIGSWNDYMTPLLYIRERDWYTLPRVIAQFNSGTSGADNSVPMLMAASLIAMLPVLAVFAIFQKKIVNSIMLSGTKG